MRLKVSIFRYFCLPKPQNKSTNLKPSFSPSSEIFSKDDLINLKENYLSIQIPKSIYKARVRTHQMEKDLVDLIGYSQENNPNRNHEKGRDYIIVDSPLTLSRSLPSVSDFFNKVLKDFGNLKTFTNLNKITNLEFPQEKKSIYSGPLIYLETKQ